MADFTTLEKRIDWILKEQRQPDGKKWSMGKLSLEAGLMRAHVSKILKGGMVPRDKTVAKIAHAAQVSALWLIKGVGDPLDLDAPDPTQQNDPNIRLNQLSYWSRLLGTARAMRPDIPQYAWEKLGHWHVELSVPLAPGALAKLAEFIVHVEPMP